MQHPDVGVLQDREIQCLKLASAAHDYSERYAYLAMALLYRDQIDYLESITDTFGVNGIGDGADISIFDRGPRPLLPLGLSNDNENRYAVSSPTGDDLVQGVSSTVLVSNLTRAMPHDLSLDTFFDTSMPSVLLKGVPE